MEISTRTAALTEWTERLAEPAPAPGGRWRLEARAWIQKGCYLTARVYTILNYSRFCLNKNKKTQAASKH